jgi:hypothetical protein
MESNNSDNNDNNNLIQNTEENIEKIKKYKEKILGVIYLNDIFKFLINNIKIEENNENLIQNENDLVVIVKEK